MKKAFLLVCVSLALPVFSSAAVPGFGFDDPGAGLTLPAAPQVRIVPERASPAGRILECVSYSKEYKLYIEINPLLSRVNFSVLDSSAQGSCALKRQSNVLLLPQPGGSPDWAGFEGNSVDGHNVEFRFRKADLGEPLITAFMTVSAGAYGVWSDRHELSCK